MKKSIKLIILGFVVLLTLAFIIYSMNKPVDVDATKIVKSDLVSDFKEDAIVVSEDSYVISPPYDAKLIFIVEQGSKVNQGELIASMDSNDLTYQKD